MEKVNTEGKNDWNCLRYNKGWRFDDTVKALYEKQLEDYSMPSEQLSIAENLQNTIDDLSVVVMTYDTEISLISSDVPVIAINPFYPHSIGYACMGLIMLLRCHILAFFCIIIS